MADSSILDMESVSDPTNPQSAESPKPISKSISTRTSPAAESREATTAPETTRSSRRASLVVSASNNKAGTSAAGSANTSARTSPQPDAGTATYGTRSRHRGANRVNYAEDNDMDFEYTSKQNPEPKSRTIKHKDAGAEPTTKEKPKVFPAINGNMTTIEEIMGGATPAAAPAKESRKRKAPGTSAVATTATQSQAPTRKTSHQSSGTAMTAGDSNMVSFEASGRKLKDGYLVADDGEKYKVNDFVYLICEPPGEPYYLARIMEFLHAGNDPKATIDDVRINWMYRPRDINRKELDTRGIFASMHSDPVPITSLRGKCVVKHRSEIDDLDEFKKQKDAFYFSQMYDRYIHRYYEIIPTKAVINVPENVKKVLDERWKYIIVEIGKGKEFTSAVKTCKRCSGYCANDNSVDCAVCKNTYHMNCVQPPLQKKPARGFAWSCGPCSRKQERKLEARNTPIMDGEDEEEPYEEEDGEAQNTGTTSPASGHSEEILTATKEQMAHAELWPYRYLGIHCKPTDALDYDDRIYPRASSRIGPRHQAHIPDWPGQPFEFIKPSEAKKKYGKSSSKTKTDKLSKEAIAGIEADREERKQRPKWVVDQPPGYLHRGEDPDNSDKHRTSTALFKIPESNERSARGEDDEAISKPDQFSEDLDSYMKRAAKIAPTLGIDKSHTNFLDRAINLYYSTGYKADQALAQLKKTDLGDDLKEPALNKEELKRFEEGVSKYGSALGDVYRHSKVKKCGTIVRYYYLWKKTDRGKAIWGVREDRKSKKHVKAVEGTYLDDVADDADDSAFDNEKAAKKKRNFQCKFCLSKDSRFWRRAPLNTPGQTLPADGHNRNKDKNSQLILALCGRCATLWRKYALRYEDIDEIAKRLAVAGGRTAKRKADEELLKMLIDASELGHVYMGPVVVTAAQQMGIEISHSLTQPTEDPARKKQKTETAVAEQPKKKEKPPAPEPPPLIPEAPKLKNFPCNICQADIPEEELYSCRHCRLTVHKVCYGIPDNKPAQKWLCDCCTNDTTNQASHEYVCTLCPMVRNEPDMYELPKTTHKKKTERDKEKERLEKELWLEATHNYAAKQEELGRPLFPREALKSTAGYRWQHVICSIFTPGIKFWNPLLLEKSERMLDIPANRFGLVCSVCRIAKGVCVSCPTCGIDVHPSCAQKGAFTLAFAVTKKSSRKDVNSIRFGNETGFVEAVISCSHHEQSQNLHPMNELFEDGSTALSTFLRHFKQADATLTGTMKKSAAIASAIKPAIPIRESNHRSSIANGTVPKRLATTVKSEEVDDDGDRVVRLASEILEEPEKKVCSNCETTISPKWWKSVNNQLNGQSETGSRQYLCHKCHIRKRDGNLAQPTPPQEPMQQISPAIKPVPASGLTDGWSNGIASGAAPVPVPLPQSHVHSRPPPVMNGHTFPHPPYGGSPYSNGFERRDIPPSPRAFNGPEQVFQPRRSTLESIPPMPPIQQNNHGYAAPPSPARLNGSSAALSAAADPFAPTQQRSAYHGQQAPPPLPPPPRQNQNNRDDRPTSSTNGGTTRPSLQDLLH